MVGRRIRQHPKDGTPEGLFRANGQGAQCTVIADLSVLGNAS